MKKIFFIICVAIIFLNSCKKTVSETVPGGNSLVLAYPATTVFNVASSGLNYYDNALLGFTLSDATDTITLSANIGVASGSDMTVNIAVDQAAFDAYAKTHPGYAIMPATYYSVVNANATIKAGETSATFKIAFNPSLFDITQTGYLLPVSITGSTGYALNSNMKTAYFHIEKDPTPPYGRADWKILGVSDEEPAEAQWSSNPLQGTGSMVLDGDPNTYWHSIWDVPSSYHPGVTSPPGFPHWIAFDMITPHVIHGIYFLERQNSSNDKAKDVTIATSDDGVTWTDVATIILANSTAWQKMPITPTNSVRYFRTTFTSNYSGAAWTNMAEIKPY